MYDSTVGRWLSEDPIGFKAGDSNVSAYVENGPTYRVDPNGLFTLAVHMEMTQTAYNNAAKNGHFGASPHGDIKIGVIKGSVNPDLPYLDPNNPSEGLGIAVEAGMAYDKALESIARYTADARKAAWEGSKSAVGWVSSLGGLHDTGLYDGLRGIRNWWQDSDMTPAMAGNIDKALEATGSDVRLKETKIYQTHYSDLAWQHCMCAQNMTAEQLHKKILDHLTEKIGAYRKLHDDKKWHQAGFALGEAVHTVQDSYSRSHVVRNDNGEIETFQDYNAQSPALHGNADNIEVGSDEFNKVVGQTEKFMAIANDRSLAGDQLRERLNSEFFKLAPGATAGGTKGTYAPRP